MTDEIALVVNGKVYAGWKSATVNRTIEAVAGSFSLAVSERWVGQSTRWPIKPGDACTVELNGETVITGYVDRAQIGFDAGSHTITVTGRDKTGDLVDCSVVHDAGEWSGLTVERLANVLAKPFGVTVTAAVSTGDAVSTFALQQGETAFEAISRVAKMRGLLPVSDGRGGIVLTRAGRGRAASSLRQGVNILSASGTFDMSDRFSKYICKGQSFGTDDLSGEAAAAVEASATDAGVPRYRPMIILAERPSDTGAATQRAQWEATVRAARAGAVEVTVQGWRQQDGALWPLNGITRLVSDWLSADNDMLITGVSNSIDESGGSITRLTLMRPDAFTPEPAVEGDADSGNLWGNVFVGGAS